MEKILKHYFYLEKILYIIIITSLHNILLCFIIE